MANTFQHKRSATPGKVPLSNQLADGELALNTADGRVFLKKADDTVVRVGADIIAEYATTASFPAVGDDQVLYVTTDTSRSYRWTGAEYVEIGPAPAISLATPHSQGTATVFTAANTALSTFDAVINGYADNGYINANGFQGTTLVSPPLSTLSISTVSSLTFSDASVQTTAFLGWAALPVASNTVSGAVKTDGTSIQSTDGVISINPAYVAAAASPALNLYLWANFR